MGIGKRVSRAAVVIAGLAMSCGTVPTSALSGPGGAGLALGSLDGQPQDLVAPDGARVLVVLAPEVVLRPEEVFSLERVVQFSDGRQPRQLSWRSSRPAVATVDALSGLVTARTPGVTEVTASLGGSSQARILVEVSTRQEVSRVEIAPPALAMDPGERRQLMARVEMARGEVTGAVIWSSSDYTVASVNPTTGEVTALQPGEITVKATAMSDVRRFGVAKILVRRLGAAVMAPAAWQHAVAETRSPMGQVVRVGYDTWFAVGAAGTLLRSDDGGSSFVHAAPPLLRNRVLGRIAFTSRDRGLLTAANELYETRDGGASWQLKLRAMAPFLDLAIGADGQGVLTDGSASCFRTSDGGESWGIDSPPGVAGIEGEKRAGGQRWLVGAGRLYGWRGGRWTALPLPTGTIRTRLNPRQLSFLDAHDGWYIGPDGRIYRTTDGGDRWYEQRLFSISPIEDVRPGALVAIRFFDRLRGAMVRGGQYLETRDGGQSWTATAIVPAQGQVTDVWWHDEGQAWLVGTGGLLMRRMPG